MKTKFNKILCDRHYRQLLKYGHIKRTRVDKNEIYSVLNISGTDVKIDFDDTEKCKSFYWYKCGENGYPVTLINNKKLYLQNYILNTDETVDHINHDIYDNRKSNLRVVNKSENMMNSNISTRNTSGVKGVSYDKSRNMWKAYIQADGKFYNLGRYTDFNDAVAVRFKNEILMFGYNSIYYEPSKSKYCLRYTFNNKEYLLEENLHT